MFNTFLLLYFWWTQTSDGRLLHTLQQTDKTADNPGRSFRELYDHVLCSWHLAEKMSLTEQAIWCTYQVGGLCISATQLERVDCPLNLSSFPMQCKICKISCIYFTIVLSSRQPAQACSTAPESVLELQQTSHCHSLSNHTQVMMVPLGHLAKGATLEDLLETCIQSFGECLEVFRVILICFYVYDYVSVGCVF